MTKHVDEILVKNITENVFWELIETKMDIFFDSINKGLFQEFK